MPDCRLVSVPPANIAQIWPAVSPLIGEAIARARSADFAEIERDVLGGRSLLWLVCDGAEIKSAVVTQLLGVNGKKFCTIVACGGSELRTWISLLRIIEDYALSEGCDYVRIVGRPGWGRVLPDYNLAMVLLEKELR